MREFVWRWTCLLFIALVRFAIADERVESKPGVVVVVRLEQGRFYSLQEVCGEIHAKLGVDCNLRTTTERKLEVTPADRLALLLAQEAGWLQVQFRADSLTIRIPDPESREVRQRNRQRLASLLRVSLDEWPAGNGLQRPPSIDPAQRTVVLIHGLESDPQALTRLQVAFVRSRVQVLQFKYPNDGPTDVAGEHLREDLHTLHSQYPKLRIALVAHSLGGLVARHALEMPGLIPGNVTDVVCLGTPHLGSELASMHPVIELLDEGLTNNFRWDVLLQSGLGEAAVDLQPGSRFLQELNRRDRPEGVRYHLAAGDRGIMTLAEQVRAAREWNEILQRRGTAPRTADRIFQLLQAAELRSGAGDGAVTVESASFRKPNNARIFHCHHLDFVQLPGKSPENHDVFLWILKELRWK